ncbi:MAG: hypothetical protein WBA74_06095, partial [Cyclobacteriaceae bacterium]
ALDVNCNSKTTGRIESLKYQRKDLINYFIDYNVCRGNEYFSFYDKKDDADKGGTSFTLRGGITRGQVILNNLRDDSYDMNYGTRYDIRIGAEVEVMLPGTSEKLAILIEPFYTRYNQKRIFEDALNEDFDETEVSYTALGLAGGLRYYFRLSEKSRLFVNGSFSLSETFDSEFFLEGLRFSPEISVFVEINGGIGYSYNDRLFFEYKYNVPSDWVQRNAEYESQYKSSAFILGYRIFK